MFQGWLYILLKGFLFFFVVFVCICSSKAFSRVFCVSFCISLGLTLLILPIQGEIPDLFPDDEVENIIGSVRPEVRASGMMDTRENCWKFFIDRVRRQLKVKRCETTVEESNAYVTFLPSITYLIVQRKVVLNGYTYGKTFTNNLF